MQVSVVLQSPIAVSHFPRQAVAKAARASFAPSMPVPRACARVATRRSMAGARLASVGGEERCGADVDVDVGVGEVKCQHTLKCTR